MVERGQAVWLSRSARDRRRERPGEALSAMRQGKWLVADIIQWRAVLMERGYQNLQCQTKRKMVDGSKQGFKSSLGWRCAWSRRPPSLLLTTTQHIVFTTGRRFASQSMTTLPTASMHNPCSSHAALEGTIKWSRGLTLSLSPHWKQGYTRQLGQRFKAPMTSALDGLNSCEALSLCKTPWSGNKADTIGQLHPRHSIRGACS
jgi:hypothetical protein